jgi:hypothetical protein
MSWTDVEDALHDAVAAGAGLSGSSVVWANQGGPRLARPFLTVRRSGPQELGSTAIVRKDYDNTAPAGTEVQTRVRRQLSFTLSVQAFTTALTGTANAVALLDAVQAQMRKRAQLDAFRAVGIALEDAGTVQDLSAVLQTDFEGRAAVDMTFRIASETLETTGYIETVNVATTLDA